MESLQHNRVLAFLQGLRAPKKLQLRISELTLKLDGQKLSRRQLRQAWTGDIHTHIDCFPWYYTLLRFWSTKYDFDFNRVQFPQPVREYWKVMGFDPSDAGFPPQVVSLFRGELPDGKRATGVALRKMRYRAAKLYGQFLVDYAGRSDSPERGLLFQYVQAIVVHILPVMQSSAAIELIIRQNLADAKRDGTRMLELRGAPQLHTWYGLSAEDALLAYIRGIDKAEIPVALILCALRHEPAEVAWDLAKLGGKYLHHGVRVLDLAGDEKSKPGVLREWMPAAVLAILLGLKLTIHKGETNDVDEEVARRLNALELIVPLVKQRLGVAGLQADQVHVSAELEARIKRVIETAIDEVLAQPVSTNPFGAHLANRLGHGFRGHMQGDRFCEVCFSSNVITKQVSSIGEHPAHQLWERGVSVIPCTDGTTLIGIRGLLDELVVLSKHGWTAERFFLAELLCIIASSFDSRLKLKMVYDCVAAYENLCP